MKIMNIKEWVLNEARGDSEYIICTTSPVGTIVNEDVVYICIVKNCTGTMTILLMVILVKGWKITVGIN